MHYYKGTYHKFASSLILPKWGDFVPQASLPFASHVPSCLLFRSIDLASMVLPGWEFNTSNEGPQGMKGWRFQGCFMKGFCQNSAAEFLSTRSWHVFEMLKNGGWSHRRIQDGHPLNGVESGGGRWMIFPLKSKSCRSKGESYKATGEFWMPNQAPKTVVFPDFREETTMKKVHQTNSSILNFTSPESTLWCISSISSLVCPFFCTGKEQLRQKRFQSSTKSSKPPLENTGPTGWGDFLIEKKCYKFFIHNPFPEMFKP